MEWKWVEYRSWKSSRTAPDSPGSGGTPASRRFVAAIRPPSAVPVSSHHCRARRMVATRRPQPGEHLHNAPAFITGSAHLIPNVPAMTSPSWPHRHGVALALYIHVALLVLFWDPLLAAAAAYASPSQTKQLYALFWA